MADVLVHVTDGYIKRATRLAAEIIALADGGYAELARVQPCQKLRQLVHQFEAGCQSQRGGHVTLTRVVEVNGHKAREVSGVLLSHTQLLTDHGSSYDKEVVAARVWYRHLFGVFLLGCGLAFAMPFLYKVFKAFGADCDEEVSLVYVPAQPGHLTFLTDFQMLPKIQSHRTAAEILQKESKALDDRKMFGAVFSGVADEDFGPRPRPVCAQGSGVRGRL